jgi:4'-phosphopantetheinyl transferase
MESTEMLPLKRLTLARGGDVTLWLAGPIDPVGVPEHLWRTLSSGEKNRANSFRRANDRVLFAITRGTLRCLLSKATAVPAEQIAFAEGPYGKPYLAGADGPYFNVSHSGTFALIGLSDHRPIGVDIEAMRAAGGELDLAKSFFSNTEYRALEGLEQDMLLPSFYKIWTCKEAVLKACGAGISEHLKDYSVHLIRDGYAIHAEPNCSSAVLASVIAEPVAVPLGYTGCCALYE